MKWHGFDEPLQRYLGKTSVMFGDFQGVQQQIFKCFNNRAGRQKFRNIQKFTKNEVNKHNLIII